MKQQKQLLTTWSPDLAYLVGIIATDGNLSSDERHIVITSKDKDLLEDIKETFSLPITIGKKASGTTTEKKYFVLQIGNKQFYDFLTALGLTKNKSKTIGKLKVPNKYFYHFLRGCIDGDGNIDIYSHKESKEKQLRIRLASASSIFLNWIFEEIKKEYDSVGGWIHSPSGKSWQVLTFGKRDSIKILQSIYLHKTIYLHRKYNQAKPFITEK